MVVVCRLTAVVEHAVDGTAPSEHPSARPVDALAVHPPLGFREELPVEAGVAPDLADPERDLEPKVVVRDAGLEQQNPVPTVFGQPVRQDAARRPCADHDVVEVEPRCWTGVDHRTASGTAL